MSVGRWGAGAAGTNEQFPGPSPATSRRTRDSMWTTCCGGSRPTPSSWTTHAATRAALNCGPCSRRRLSPPRRSSRRISSFPQGLVVHWPLPKMPVRGRLHQPSLSPAGRKTPTGPEQRNAGTRGAAVTARAVDGRDADRDRRVARRLGKQRPQPLERHLRAAIPARIALARPCARGEVDEPPAPRPLHRLSTEVEVPVRSCDHSYGRLELQVRCTLRRWREFAAPNLKCPRHAGRRRFDADANFELAWNHAIVMSTSRGYRENVRLRCGRFHDMQMGGRRSPTAVRHGSTAFRSRAPSSRAGRHRTP